MSSPSSPPDRLPPSIILKAAFLSSFWSGEPHSFRTVSESFKSEDAGGGAKRNSWGRHETYYNLLQPQTDARLYPNRMHVWFIYTHLVDFFHGNLVSRYTFRLMDPMST